MTTLDREYLLGEYGGLERLQKETWIYLSGRKINKIDKNAFKGLKNIEVLWLHENEIEEMGENCLVDQTNLRELRLDGNKLKRMDVRCFEQLKSMYLNELYKNQFEKEIKSYFNESLAPGCFNIEDKKKRLIENGGYKSDWKEFLDQFVVLEKEREEKVNRNEGEAISY